MSTRLVLRGGVAFAALGALGVVTAAPALADTTDSAATAGIGYAEASATEGEGRIHVLHQRQADFHGTHRYQYDEEIYTVAMTGAVTDVDRDLVDAGVQIDELRIELTEADVAAMRAAAEGGVSQPGLENTEPEDGGEGEREGDASDEVVLRAIFTSTEISVAQNWTGTGAEYAFEPGDESVEVNELGADISLAPTESSWEETVSGESLWGIGHDLDLVVDLPDEGFSVTYDVAETRVGLDLDPAASDGDDDQGAEDGEGDQDGDPGEPDDGTNGDTDSDTDSDGDTDTDSGTDGQDGESGEGNADSGTENDGETTGSGSGNGSGGPLARTGAPVTGLITAAVALAAGGGAIAYAARRRKSA